MDRPGRTILHMDMDAFFASVEQACNPALRGRPVAVIGSAERTVVTTSSYEARRLGVRTGMSKYEARRVCPSLVLVVGDNRKYIDTSTRIFEILRGISPMVEVYSIDEAFVDITGTSLALGPPEAVAAAVKGEVARTFGLSCSIGIAPNKLLAKLASGMKKPGGVVVIKPRETAALLEALPVGELWGIGPRLTGHLLAMGISTCGELGRFPPSLLRRRFGITGERLGLMGSGLDDSPVAASGETAMAKSIGHSTTLPRDLSDRAEIEKHLLRLSEMVGRRARSHGFSGTRVSLTIRYPDFHTRTRSASLPAPTDDTRVIYLHARSILDSLSPTKPLRLIGVGISGLTRAPRQECLFEDDSRRQKLLEAMDNVNDRFGEFTLTWARLKEGSGVRGPQVIPPSWRPAGVKRLDVI